ncbi:hypothetical protein ASF72_00525 [Arthrobacter sp. Leaf141]|nr:hypothetical protein ASF72_00525 [Arthrobacter sp. Leaf141]
MDLRKVQQFGIRLVLPEQYLCFVPVQVRGLTVVQSIVSPYCSAYAVKTDGTVWSWGLNSFFGQLGNGTTTDSYVSVQVTGLTGVRNVVADSFSVHAVKTDGTVWAWAVTTTASSGTSVPIYPPFPS